MTKTYDAIVIGAGVIGACVAFELSKKGYHTLNVDKLPAAGYGSTSNSCGIIRLNYSTLEGIAMALEGYYYWKDWAGYLGVEDEKGWAKFVETGCVVFKTEDNGYMKSICGLFDQLGVVWEDWDLETLRRHRPHFDPHCFAPVRRIDDPGFGEHGGEYLTGAIYYPIAGYVGDPQLSTHNVQRAAEARGGEFLFNAEVAEIPRHGGRVAGVVLKDGQRLEAPVVVNVAGPHSYLINRLAGVEEDMKVKTRALRQEVAHVPSPPGLDFERDASFTSDNDIGCYYRPELGNNILIGSEDPECDAKEWVDPDDYNRDFTDQWTNQVQRLAQRIPDLGIPNRAKGIVDLYDVSDDWIPIYDRSSLDGYYMAIGTSGNQYKNAPVAGAMMADLIERSEAGHDHDADPLRFPLRHTGFTANVGFYSRLREINEESSFSVLG